MNRRPGIHTYRSPGLRLTNGARLHLYTCVASLLVCIRLSAGLAPMESPSRLVYEAELCREMTYPWQPVQLDGASGGQCLTLPEGAGSSEAFRYREVGHLWFDLPIPADGVYELWLRVRWHGNCSNSIYATFDDMVPRGAGIASRTMQRWHWVRALSEELEAGIEHLTIGNREDGVWLDQLCLQPQDSPEPEGILAADAVWPVPHESTPGVTQTLCVADAGVEALPPTDFLLHHQPIRNQPLAPLPTLLVTPGTHAPLDLWVRVNRPAALPARCKLEAPASVTVGPSRDVQFDTPDPPLQRHDFSIRAHPDLARGVTPMRCRLRTADGFEQIAQVMLLRPYRWRVSQPFRLNPKAGISQRSDLDQALLTGPTATGANVEWSLVQPSHFTPFGMLDLRRAVSDKTYMMAYATTEVEWQRDETACLDVSHDDWIQIWLNEKEVYRSEACMPATLTRQLVRVQVRKGMNTLLVKCCQLKNYWEFNAILRPLDSVSRPVQTWEAEQ